MKPSLKVPIATRLMTWKNRGPKPSLPIAARIRAPSPGLALRRAAADSASFTRAQTPMRPRGFPLSCQPCTNSTNASSSTGKSTISVTSRSPRPPPFLWKPRPLQAQHLARGRSLGDRQHHRAVGGRHAHFGAEHRFGQADRQVEPDIVAVAREKRCGWTSIVTIASPAPPGPSSPLPASRIWVPVSTPAGSLRSIVLPSRSVIRCGASFAASSKATARR